MRRRRGRLRRPLAPALLLAVIAVSAGALLIRHKLRGSLPILEGSVALHGLQSSVRIERDALGVPTIHASSREDAAFATGFLHAQERFFQMDLMRRRAAGELSSLFGEAAVGLDKAARRHRFRALARRILANSGSRAKSLLNAYARGVNAGVASLQEAPFEFLLLRDSPKSWLPEDSLLAIDAMALDLQDDDASHDAIYGLMHDRLSPPIYRFLAVKGTEWDAPLRGNAFSAPGVPPAEAERGRPMQESAAPLGMFAEPLPAGSNNFAVAGFRTLHGGALLANDMHLGIGVPNTWYRLSVVYPGAGGGKIRVMGVTLPGTPAVVVGSNGHIAWGFTNAQIDTSDRILLEETEQGYRTPDGVRPFRIYRETIQVKSGPSQTIEVKETIWGPVVKEDGRGRKEVASWTGDRVDGVNMGLLDLETAQTVKEAIAIAHRAAIPAQNMLVADEAGHIGWTIIGPVPHRSGYDGRLPVSFADGSKKWVGLLAPGEYPVIVDPPDGILFTANNRVVEGEDLGKLGDGGYALGARAGQIGKRLRALDKASERDLLAIQLDDEAIFLSRWRELLLTVPARGDPLRAAARRLARNWGGHASVDSAGYRIVRAFRRGVAKRLLDSLTASCRRKQPDFRYYYIRQYEGPLWRLVKDRPKQYLPPGVRGYDELFTTSLDEVLGLLTEEGRPLAEMTWGRRNMSRIRHPMSPFIPLVGRVLDMPSHPLPGDGNMPRYQGVSSGASERLVVSPGREESGLFEMPCGQSGHPLSPHYRDMHSAWEEGLPTPFLAGPAVQTLILEPIR